MHKTDLLRVDLPDTPGVYFFRDKMNKILYLGKATSLRSRVGSYFSSDIANKRSFLIEKMVKEAHNIDFTQTDSVLEALILEANLISTHKPKYNTKGKDDKSYNHIVVTEEEFPRVLIMRAKDLDEAFLEKGVKCVFGPFPNSSLLREVIKITRKLFQFYDTEKSVKEMRGKLAVGKINFNKQIGIYPKTEIKSEYKRNIRHLILFFQGKKKKVVAELKKEMMTLAKSQQFEKANEIKKKIFALNHIQDVALIKKDSLPEDGTSNFKIEAYDVAHLDGDDMVGVMVVSKGGILSKEEYRKFKIEKYDRANDPGALKEILNRRFKHKEWNFPDLLVVDGSTAQINVTKIVLDKYRLKIPIVSVVKDKHHKPVRLTGNKDLLLKNKEIILLLNAEAHRFAINYHRKKRNERIFRN